MVRLSFEARIAEAYAALEAMLEDEERMRLQSEAEGADLPYEMVEDRYDSTTEEGAKQNALPTCRERTTENLIADTESEVRRFREPLPKTLDIGESNPGGVCEIRERRPPTARNSGYGQEREKEG